MPRRLIALLIAVGCLAGCGGDAADDRRERATTVVAALGDSITAGTPGWDPNPAIRAQIGAPDPRSQYGYWAERAHPGTDFRNCGVPGERTDEIGERLESCSRGADVLILEGGLNDIAQGASPASAAANLRATARRAKALGLRVAIAELLPWNGSYPRVGEAIRELNRRIGRIGRSEDVAVLAWYDELEDPRHPGRMRPDLRSDLTHPSVKGYRLLGESVELP
jgi:lysophospholipase L1-like esterase